MEQLIIVVSIILGLLLAVVIYNLASGKDLSESFAVFTGMLQRSPKSQPATVVVSQSTSAKPTGWSSLKSLIGFLIGTALVMYVIMLTYGYGVKTIREITGDNGKKSSTIIVSTGETKTLRFRSEAEAQFEFIARPGMLIDFDYFPCDGEIITSTGRYKIGPSYGYDGVPGGIQNTYWKCVSLGNPFEGKIYISKK